MSDYKVQFDVFEGPLDLLLYLIKKEEVDIYEVNLTKIAEEFVQYLDLMRELDLDLAGEFLVMAATLMYIKSRELLPVDQQAPGDEEEAGDDPRWELIRQLVQYKKFKDAAVRLHDLELRQEHIYRRIAARPDFAPPPEAPRLDVSLFDLLNAVSEVLKRANRRDDLREIFEDKWTVSDKIETLGRLLRERPRLRFSELFGVECTRSEVVVTFLALLELIRLKQVMAVQNEPFSEIELVSRVISASAGTEERTLAPPTA